MPTYGRGNKVKNGPLKGYYTPINPHKYVAKGKPYFRSSWEKRCYYFMDHNENVIEWGAESMVVPYLFTLDGKVHKYYPDIICKIQTKHGIQTFMLEVKPAWQTIEPDKPKNRSLKRKARYDREMMTYIKNTDKWTAAREVCEREGFIFKLITEKEIFGYERNK